MIATLIGYFCATFCGFALSLGPPGDLHSTETVKMFGVPIGRYVDDTDPQECADVSFEKSEGWPIVIAGMAPGGGPTCPGAIMAREYYSFDCGYTASSMGPVPEASAYILQRRFAFPPCRPPTYRQRTRVFRRVEKKHPLLVLWY